MRTNIKLAISELHKAFYCFNDALFNQELPEPAILIQNRGNKKNVLGWCSNKEIWINEKEQNKKYEINIVAESLNRTLCEIMSTLLHEMVHLYNSVNNIKDTSRNSTYHNKAFKKSAENYGLIIEHDKKTGWSDTKLREETEELVNSFSINEGAFDMFRIDKFTSAEGQDGEGEEGIKKRKSSVRKYVCPKCDTIIRSTKDVNVLCGICKLKFEKEEDL